MEIQFAPNDALSETLLASIPKKVVGWIKELEAKYGDELFVERTDGIEFLREKISISLANEAGLQSYLSFDDDDGYVDIWWSGHWDNPEDIYVSDLTLVEASIHLDHFVAVEKKFYDELTLLQKEQERLHPDPRMPSTYVRDENAVDE